jgi:hypothetical protein
MDVSFCLSCAKKETCTKICPELEKTLPKDLTGKNTKKEINVGDVTHLSEIEEACNLSRNNKKYISREEWD